jgi:hypothetical protein
VTDGAGREETRIPEEAYRKGAVERFAMLDDLDYLLEVSPPRYWLALLGIALVLGAAMAWGVLGRVSTRVDGEGFMTAAGLGAAPGGAAVLFLSAADARRVRPGMRAWIAHGDGGPADALRGRVTTVRECSAAAHPPRTVPVCIALENEAGAPSARSSAIGSITVRRERPIAFVFPWLAEGRR